MLKKKIRLFYFSEIHGSDLCFFKILNLATCNERPDIIIIGGNICGTKIVPILINHKNDESKIYGECIYEGKKFLFKNEIQITRFMIYLSAKGDYGWKCNFKQYRIFQQRKQSRDLIIKNLKIKKLKKWIDIINEVLINDYAKIYFIPGTDDPLEIDNYIEKNDKVTLLNNKIIHFNDDITLLGLAYSSINQINKNIEFFRYKSFNRNITEEELHEKFWKLVEEQSDEEDFSKYIFCISFPPKKTTLDTLEGYKSLSLGSQKIREIIEKTHPPISLHSFTFEKKRDHIGITEILNPGSLYHIGGIQFVVIEYENNHFKKPYFYENEIFPDIGTLNGSLEDVINDAGFIKLILKFLKLIPLLNFIPKVIEFIEELTKKDVVSTEEEKVIEIYKKYLNNI